MLSVMQHADMIELNEAAAEAWAKVPAKSKSITFTWRGDAYTVSHTGFRLVVKKLDGHASA